ncbi:MAG TPA: ATP-dependent DNA helicase RecG, partial [Planctomycetaceae bacterium]|nr:ATP-dependent DNA helicase RecG [Planctomycetaceae bacterium]
ASVDPPLETPVQFVRGVGPLRAELFQRLGIATAEDLLWYLPRDVLDLTKVSAVHEITDDRPHVVRGEVVDKDARTISNNRTLTAVLFKADGGYVRAVWFNQPYMLRKFDLGSRVLISGQPKFRDRRWEFSHPGVQWLEEDDGDATPGVLPRYGLTEGLRMPEVRRATAAAVEDFAEFVPDRLPESFRNEQRLPELKTAIRQLHRPNTVEEYEAARRRIVFDDLFEFQVAIALRRQFWQKDSQASPLECTAKIDARIRRLFPFRFTAGQDQAVTEIVRDLARDQAMHRLLQADVGAGKTAVAVYAMLVAIANQRQAVLMAPTEVLALQHWQTIETLLAQSRVERRLLTGQLTSKQRQDVLDGITSGTVQLVVGTQAVIQKDVQFANLALAVIDEQHKFGVGQRSRFSGAELSPHLLVMTATPIPRSLCLTQFGDLDLTTISELPPGRQKVVTSLVSGPAAMPRAWEFVRKKLREGRQAYVVCPRIGSEDDFDGDTGSATAETMYRELSQGELRGFRVGLMHGQQPRDVRQTTMDAFRDGELDVLVATTVIEVGVDVANATLMVICQAERFGLSQLHQLRGRIGRGQHQGYCFLWSHAVDQPDATRRLAALESTSDGFQIAEVDFELRGPGDILGTRQHGELPLRVASLVKDRELLEHARTVAFRLVETGRMDEPEFAPLKVRVLDRFHKLMDLPQTG